MTTELKSATARANGAKSKGPKTAAGLEKSSRNALTHGLTSRHTLLLDVESRAQFQEMIDDYNATYQPTTRAQQKMVDEMVAARWRLDRIWMIETALVSDEMRRRDAVPAENPEACNPGMQIAKAFQSLADGSQALALACRYQSTHRWAFEHAYRTLRELQKNDQPKTPAKIVQMQPPPPQPPQPEEPSSQPPVVTSPEPPTSPRLENQRIRNEPTSLRSPRRRRRWLALFRPADPGRRRAA